mmetsp:Transcript_76782/g.225416  ORF Transcript_76782/g.225416 Transcript_76782/m.225416 type:complete len:289 (-) Transcript_76782:76-942(-)
MARAWLALAGLCAARLALGEEGEQTSESATGALSQMGHVMDALSNFLGKQEDSSLDAGGELSLAYSSPRDGAMQAVRLKLKDLALASPAKLLATGSGSATMSAEEEAAEAEALDEAIAIATEGIHFMGADGPSAATVLRARVAGSPSFRQIVARNCRGAEGEEHEPCRRATGEDLLCKLAKAAPGAGEEEAAARSELCGEAATFQPAPQQLMLKEEKVKTSVRSEEASTEGVAMQLAEAQEDVENLASEVQGEKAKKPWEKVELLAGSMLQALQETAADGSYEFQWRR